MAAPSFLVFSDDWGEHPSSCQHIFRHLAREHQVLWVNTIGMRTPRLTLGDARKVVYKAKKMLLGAQKGEKASAPQELRLRVYQPPMLPFAANPLVRKYNKAVVVRGVRRELQRAGIDRPILVSTVPNAGDYVGSCGESRVVYYCVDDFTEWPGLDHRLVREMERELIGKADVFIATSEKLRRRLAAAGKPTCLLTHGVDPDFFRRRAEGEHALLAHIPRPRVGYFGLFDERSDLHMLRKVASALPGISFVITGRVEADISALRELPNIHCTGPVPYAELPMLVQGWDACFLLYVRSTLTDAISPLKLKEYLATGKPVFCTPLPEARALAPFLHFASSAEEWIEGLRGLLSGERMDSAEGAAARMDFLAGESWQRKAAIFREIVTAADGNRQTLSC